MRITTKDLVPDYSLEGCETWQGVAAYLVELKIPGIGKKLAHDIALRYREATFDKIMEGPDSIAYSVNGIGKMRALALYEAIHAKLGSQIEERQRKRNEMERAAAIFWGAIDVSARMRRRITDHFGDFAANILLDNPYRLTEIDGIGFKRADEIAAKFGITGSEPRRIKAGIIYTLNDIATMKGDCCLPRSEVVRIAAKHEVLGIGREEIEPVIDEMIEADELIGDEGMIYLPQMYDAEMEVAERLIALQKKDVSAINPLPYLLDRMHIDYNEEQQEAIRMAMTEHLMVLTGGPGTGKTTTLKGILLAMRLLDKKCVLCAPTGRAAKRMCEATGTSAHTVHMMLGYDNGEFVRNEDSPLKEDVVICDESSMIDIMLMRALLRAMPKGGRLILIGDNDQLPSVGPGRVLGDIIDSGKVPTVRLTQIYRQQEGSYIIYNAHNIISGRLPIVQGATDFFFLPAETEEQAQNLVVSLVSERLPKAYPGEEIQVLSPMRKEGVKTGCNELNKLLQQALNPNGHRLDMSRGRLRVDDRVMQTKNNYKLGVFNGDVGVVEGMGYTVKKWTSPDGEEHTFKSDDFEIQVRYPDGWCASGYDEESVRSLDLAYATTIHKSQGSEYDTVVIVLMRSALHMLQRHLLYTAVTRAKKRCIIVGDWECVRESVSTWKTKPRFTRLKERL